MTIFSLPGVSKCLCEGANLIGKSPLDWHVGVGVPTESMILQQQLLDQMRSLPDPAWSFLPELSALATRDAKAMRDRMAALGSPHPAPDPNSADFTEPPLYMHSKLLLPTRWLSPGRKTTLRAHPSDATGRPDTMHSKQEFPAFTLTKRDHGVSFIAVKGYDEPLICIYTQSGDLLYIFQRPNDGLDGLGILDVTREIKAAMDIYDWRFNDIKDVTLPCVDYSADPDLGWMRGMRIVGSESFSIDLALQHNTFKMNHLGALHTSDTFIQAGTISIDMASKSMVVDQSFVAWQERLDQTGLVQNGMPIMALHVDTNAWRDPGEF
jgi:hypothetical protein